MADQDVWEGGQGRLAEDWLQWMNENVPEGGWRTSFLTFATDTKTFKKYGSLWRCNPRQWNLFLERGHTDIFKAEKSLKKHPYVKGHTLKRIKIKGMAGRTVV